MMKVQRLAEHEISEDSVRAATGRGLDEWFSLIDARGGENLGRRAIGDWMNGELKIAPWWTGTITCEYEIARGQVEKDGQPKGYTICVTKGIKADAGRCYDAFTGSALLDKWFGGNNRIELKEAGRWQNGDGNAATIRKLNPGRNIRLNWEDAGLTMPTPVEIKFKGTAGKCTVMVTIDRLQTRAEADGYREAWGRSLDQLKLLLEK
ncbi:MAG: hypothetical protein A3H91_11565 [Gammaproteobacteria bacterium RIFCSPLOWO2_02_FULL_61_13]|nr:MAG: hypothetical protein A3H91_11565 [Gammaproteobacteria bacterium RIFCSPLOWO2_02_FULL_61_13]